MKNLLQVSKVFITVFGEDYNRMIEIDDTLTEMESGRINNRRLRAEKKRSGDKTKNKENN